MYTIGVTQRRIFALVMMVSCLVTQAACSGGTPAQTVARAPATNWHSDKQKAEYAFRWTLPQQGFESAADTVQWLQQYGGLVNPQKEEKSSVVYFTVAQPAGFPGGYNASFRLRGTDDFTYKVRGPAPWPETLGIPVCGTLKVDAEYDVSIGADGTIANLLASHSCDGDSWAAFGGEFENDSKVQRPCTISMERTRLDWSVGSAESGKAPKEVKVEQWTFSRLGYEKQLVEISWKAKAGQSEEDMFSVLVKSLPKGFPATLPPGKELTAAECDAGM